MTCARGAVLAVTVLVACQSGPRQHALALVGGSPSIDQPGVVFLHDSVAVRSCTGSAISRRVVVTAKHCLMDTIATNWIVAVGDVARPDDQRDAEYAVADMRLAGDPAVLVQGDGEDVAVLLLAEDFGYEPIPWGAVLPPEFVAGSNVTLRAYGDVDPAEDVITFGTRMERTAPAYDIRPGTFSADVGGCNGDSGGPGLDDAGRVLGVASYADLPACGGWTRFERLDVQAAMIQQAIDDTGGDDPVGDGDADADGDIDPDADVDADGAANGDAGDDGPASGGAGGCSCGLVP